MTREERETESQMSGCPHRVDDNKRNHTGVQSLETDSLPEGATGMDTAATHRSGIKYGRFRVKGAHPLRMI